MHTCLKACCQQSTVDFLLRSWTNLSQFCITKATMTCSIHNFQHVPMKSQLLLALVISVLSSRLWDTSSPTCAIIVFLWKVIFFLFYFSWVFGRSAPELAHHPGLAYWNASATWCVGLYSTCCFWKSYLHARQGVFPGVFELCTCIYWKRHHNVSAELNWIRSEMRQGKKVGQGYSLGIHELVSYRGCFIPHLLWKLVRTKCDGHVLILVRKMAL